MSKDIFRSILAISLLILSLFGFGCRQNPASSGLSDPFTNSMSFFTLKGYADGYVPGQKYNFDLTLNNQTPEKCQSKYSVYLIDGQGVVLDIVSQRPFTLPPESTTGSSFDLTLPEDLQDGAYGLMLVFPGQGTSITTIHVGTDVAPNYMPPRVEDNPPPAINLWPDPSLLPQL